MSLFGSLMGDFEDDPFFGSHMQSMQQMNSMVNSMFADFGMMGPPMIGHGQNSRMLPMGGMQMMPFGFAPMAPSFGNMFSSMQNMSQNPNCHSFTSSSIMTMTTSPDGRPQVYQESMSTRSGPGGVRETKKSVSDSRSGTRKLAIGHHIGDRAHIVEREQNVHSGDQEEHQEFINLEEEEAESFNSEWQNRASRGMAAIGATNYRSNRGQEPRQLALPSTATSSSQQSVIPPRKVATPRRGIRLTNSSKSNNSSISRSTESTNHSVHDEVPAATASDSESSTIELVKNTNRKREHSPEIEEIIIPKRHSTGSSDLSSPAAATKTPSVDETQAKSQSQN